MIIVRKTLLLFFLNLLVGQNWFQIQIVERQFNQAVVHYNDGRYATSETILKKILNEESGDYGEPSLLLLIKSQIGLIRIQSAKESTRQFFEKYPESQYLKNVMECLGDLYVNEGTYSSAYRMYHRAKKLSVEIDFSRKVDLKIQRLIQFRLPDSLLDELLTTEIAPEVRNVHLIAKANSQILNGNPDDGALTLNQVDLGQLSDTYFPFYENLLRATYQPPSPVMMVGIVLPLSGKEGEVGNAFLTGFYDGEKSNTLSKQRLSILAQDSRSDDLEAIKVAKDLAKLGQVNALVCPLDNQSSIAVTSSLASSDLPIILTNPQQNDLSEIMRFAAYFHNEFQYIHPFGDGNSRTTRLLTFHILQSQGIPFLDIPFGLLDEYLNNTKKYVKRSDKNLSEHLQKIILFNLKYINSKL